MKIEYHRVDDWEALYADDNCVGQGHSGQLELWFSCLSFPVTIESYKEFYHEDAGDPWFEYVEEKARFPDTRSEIK